VTISPPSLLEGRPLRPPGGCASARRPDDRRYPGDP